MVNYKFWKTSSTIAHKLYLIFPICPKHNPSKSFCRTQCHFPLLNLPFETRQFDYIQMSPTEEYKFVFVLIWIFYHWIRVFPSEEATTLPIRIIVSETNTSTWGISVELHGDYGIYFTGQVCKCICKISSIMQHFHCAYHLQLSGMFELTTGTIKNCC